MCKTEEAVRDSKLKDYEISFMLRLLERADA